MGYYFSTTTDRSFQDTVQKVIAKLKEEGFGVLTDIDVKKTLKEKLDVDFHEYRILGACNPPYAYEALQEEDKVGTMLPCNVVVQQKGEGKVEVSAVDPVASMQAIRNEKLREIAIQIQSKLRAVIESV